MPATADAAVAGGGGGTIGGWCAYLLRQAGLDQAVLLENGAQRRRPREADHRRKDRP